MSSVPPLPRRTKPPARFTNLSTAVMNQAQQIPKPTSPTPCGTQAEDLPASPPALSSWLPRLALGGAICGGFAGSFAGALLGMAIGVVYRDISVGLDGALLGGLVGAVGGAAYGLILALRERKNTHSSADKTLLI